MVERYEAVSQLGPTGNFKLEVTSLSSRFKIFKVILFSLIMVSLFSLVTLQNVPKTLPNTPNPMLM